jgi:hypothetical protein
MSEETDEEYDPEVPAPPEREPPRRSTAPQSAYTTRQVQLGVAVVLVGLAVTVGVPLLLA